MNNPGLLVIDRTSCPELASSAPPTSEVVAGADELLALGRALADSVERVHYAGGRAGRTALVSGLMGASDGTRTPCLVDHGVTSRFVWDDESDVVLRSVPTLKVLGGGVSLPRVACSVGFGRAVSLPLLLEGLEVGSLSAISLAQRVRGMLSGTADARVRWRPDSPTAASSPVEESDVMVGMMVSAAPFVDRLPFRIPGGAGGRGAQALVVSAGSRFRPWEGLKVLAVAEGLRLTVTGEWSVDSWYQGVADEQEILVVPGGTLMFGRVAAVRR